MHLLRISTLLLIASQSDYGFSNPTRDIRSLTTIDKRESIALKGRDSTTVPDRALMARSNSGNEIEKRWFGVVAYLGSKIVGTVTKGFLIGMGNIFAVAGGIQNVAGNVGLLDAAIQACFSIWSAEFVFAALARRDNSGNHVFAVRTRPVGENGSHRNPWTRIDAHIHVGNHSLQRAAILEHKNDSWLHIATLYSGDNPTFHISHRLAHPEDLGKEHNGAYHHVRASPVAAKGAQKRAEANAGGIVADYLWNDAHEDIWEDVYFDTTNADGLAGDALSSNMWNGGWEVSCASVFETKGELTDDADEGLVGFGWNNQPFGWNGRAGEWLNDCFYPERF